MKKTLKLTDIKVNSFITNAGKIMGGATCPVGTYGCCQQGPPEGGSCEMGTRGCCPSDGDCPQNMLE